MNPRLLEYNFKLSGIDRSTFSLPRSIITFDYELRQSSLPCLPPLHGVRTKVNRIVLKKSLGAILPNRGKMTAFVDDEIELIAFHSFLIRY